MARSGYASAHNQIQRQGLRPGRGIRGLAVARRCQYVAGPGAGGHQNRVGGDLHPGPGQAVGGLGTPDRSISGTEAIHRQVVGRHRPRPGSGFEEAERETLRVNQLRVMPYRAS